MSKVPVTVCIIAKNEEKHIEECLKRLKSYGFEIIVTDTGSTDRTKEIAKKYADKVLDFEWINDFSAARNFCASHASNNWILALDCDEYVTDINIAELRQYMQKYPKYIGRFTLKNLLINPEGEEWYSTDDVNRLYNKNYYGFINNIHEQIAKLNPDERQETLQCFMMPLEAIHHGYALRPEEAVYKQNRNLELLYKNLENNPDDVYTLFQIGQSLFMINKLEEAASYYEKALSYGHDASYIYVQMAVISLAKVYNNLGRNKEALELMESYAERIKTAKFVYLHANLYVHNNEPLKALLNYIKATMLPDFGKMGKEQMNCYNSIINIYLAMGDEKMADMFRGKYEAAKAEWERVQSIK